MKNSKQKPGKQNRKIITVTVSRYINNVEVTVEDILTAIQTAAILERSQRRDATAKHWQNIADNMRAV